LDLSELLDRLERLEMPVQLSVVRLEYPEFRVHKDNLEQSVTQEGRVVQERLDLMGQLVRQVQLVQPVGLVHLETKELLASQVQQVKLVPLDKLDKLEVQGQPDQPD
jgi:hypothetical protein